MPNEFEELTEQAVEQVLEEAEEETKKGNGGSEGKWFNHVALSSAIFAILSACTTLLADYASDKVSDESNQELLAWMGHEIEENEYLVVSSRAVFLEALGKPLPPGDQELIEKYKVESEEEEEEAMEKKLEVGEVYESYDLLLFALAGFQLAIMLGAIAMLVKRKSIWHIGIGFAGAGFLLMIGGTVMYFQ